MKLPSLLLALTANAAFSQGDLAPFAAPAPVMKTLAQIEPRTDVLTLAGGAGASRIISAPGSYFLSGNLTIPADGISGVRITASNVTLNLEGFQIAGAGTNAGIEMVGVLKGIVITNGSILGFGYSINSGGALTDSRIAYLNARGAVTSGISLGSDPSNTVEHCAVRGGQTGIQAGQVHYCTATDASEVAISASMTVTHSSGIGASSFLSSSVGISGQAGVINCYGEGGSSGISGSFVTDSVGKCTSINPSEYGIKATYNVHNCVGDAVLGGLGVGIDAGGNVSLSHGSARDGVGISAGGNVHNSTGVNSYEGDGIVALGNVQNSTGITEDGTGIVAGGSVSNSSGSATPRIFPESFGTGIKAKIITFSDGKADIGGKGLDCTTAVGCTSSGGDAITNNYQMP